MFYKRIIITLCSVFLLPLIINAHGNDEHKVNDEVEKITTFEHKFEAPMDTLSKTEKNELMEKDFSTIKKEVEESSVTIAIKAVSLAILIVCLAYFYFFKKQKKENPNV